MTNGELHYYGDEKNSKLLWPLTLLGPAMEFEVEFTRIAGTQGFVLDIPAIARRILPLQDLQVIESHRAHARCLLDRN